MSAREQIHFVYNFRCMSVGSGFISILENLEDGIVETLKIDQRDNVFDVCWCESEPNILASASGEGFVHVWNIGNKFPRVWWQKGTGHRSRACFERFYKLCRCLWRSSRVTESMKFLQSVGTYPSFQIPFWRLLGTGQALWLVLILVVSCCSSNSFLCN